MLHSIINWNFTMKISAGLEALAY